MTMPTDAAPISCWLCRLRMLISPNAEPAPDWPITAEAFAAHLEGHGIAQDVADRLRVPPAQDVTALRLPVRLNTDDVEVAVVSLTSALVPHRLTHAQILAELDAARWDVITVPGTVDSHVIVCDDFRPRASNTLATALCGGPLVTGPALFGRYGIDFGGPRGTEEWRR